MQFRNIDQNKPKNSWRQIEARDFYIICHLLKQDHSIPTDKQVQTQR